MTSISSPPIRSADNWPALWKGLADNTLQIVSTDHCPFNFKDQKELGRGNFSKIPNGAAGLEERLPMMYDGGVNGGHYDVTRFVEITAANPAKMFGMWPRKGALLPGSDADIVLIDPSIKRKLTKDDFHITDYSIWDGFDIEGWPTTTILRGKVVVENGTFSGAAGDGKFQSRKIDPVYTNRPAC